jgi:hypothetical protein
MSIIIPSGGKRLSQSDSYERPTKTITESIQNKKSIEEQLINFEEIPDNELCYINPNTQLKYLGYDKKLRKELFRFGGLLVKVNKEYIVLAGKDGMRFSVQRYTKNDKGDIIHTTRFFRKIKDTILLKNELDETKQKSLNVIERQNEIIEKQKQELMAMKKKLNSKLKK